MCLSVYYLDCWLPLLIVCCLPLWPRLLTGNPVCLPPALTHCSASDYDSALSTLPSIPLLDICLFDLLFVLIKLQVDLLSPLTSHSLHLFHISPYSHAFVVLTVYGIQYLSLSRSNQFYNSMFSMFILTRYFTQKLWIHPKYIFWNTH